MCWHASWQPLRCWLTFWQYRNGKWTSTHVSATHLENFKIKLQFQSQNRGTKKVPFSLIHEMKKAFKNKTGNNGHGNWGSCMFLITRLKMSWSAWRHVCYSDVLLQQHPLLIKAPRLRQVSNLPLIFKTRSRDKTHARNTPSLRQNAHKHRHTHRRARA